MGGVDSRVRHRDVHVRAARRDVPRLGSVDGRESPELSRGVSGIVGILHGPGDVVRRCREHVGSRPQVLHQLFRRPGLGSDQREDAVAGLGQSPVGLHHPCPGGRRQRRQPKRFRPTLHGRRRHDGAGRLFENHQCLTLDVGGGKGPSWGCQQSQEDRGEQKRLSQLFSSIFLRACPTFQKRRQPGDKKAYLHRRTALVRMLVISRVTLGQNPLSVNDFPHFAAARG